MKIKLFYSSTKKDGKEYVISQNLYKCTEKCYQKFYEDKKEILYKKQDIIEKKDGKWIGTCKKCRRSWIDNTVEIGAEFEEDAIEHVLDTVKRVSTQLDRNL